MKKLRNSLPLLVAGTLLLLSSCQRGYGCPGTNFSIGDLISLF